MPSFPLTFDYSVDDVMFILNTTDYSIKRGIVVQLESNTYSDGAASYISSKKYRIDLDGDESGTVYVLESNVYATYDDASLALNTLITS